MYISTLFLLPCQCWSDPSFLLLSLLVFRHSSLADFSPSELLQQVLSQNNPAWSTARSPQRFSRSQKTWQPSTLPWSQQIWHIFHNLVWPQLLDACPTGIQWGTFLERSLKDHVCNMVIIRVDHNSISASRIIARVCPARYKYAYQWVHCMAKSKCTISPWRDSGIKTDTAMEPSIVIDHLMICYHRINAKSPNETVPRVTWALLKYWTSQRTMVEQWCSLPCLIYICKLLALMANEMSGQNDTLVMRHE